MSRRFSGALGDDPRTARGRSLAQLFRNRAAEGGDAPAMRAKRHGVWRSYSWSEVERKVRAIACGLGEVGIRDGDTIAAIGENIVELYWIEYAALCWGARIVCLYPDVGADELAYLVDHSGAKILFAEDQEQVDKAMAARDRLPALERVVYADPRGLGDYDHAWLIPLDELSRRGAAADDADPARFPAAVAGVGAERIAVICYTSGTTGRPKGVMLSHRYLIDNAYRVMAAFRLRERADYLSYISPAWAAEQMIGLALGLLAPLTVNFAEKPETVRSDLRELGPELLLFTPRQWEMMASEVQSHMLDAAPWRKRLYDWAIARRRPAGDGDGPGGRLVTLVAEWLMLRAIRDNLGLKHTRAALSGGAGMSAEVFRLFRALGVPLSNLYGSTEIGLIAAHWSGRRDPATMGELFATDPTIGEPIEIAFSAQGELLVAGGAHFAGYWRNDDATAELRDAEGLRSGDAVTVNADGQLIFLDRLKDLRTLSGGQKYPPQFIENHLRASPFIRDAMVIGDERHPFVTALVNIDAGISGRFAERRGLAFGTFAELSQLAEIRNRIGAEIGRVNALLEEPARVRRFATLPKELDPDEAELTRSRKLRRDQIDRNFRHIVAALYDGSAGCEARISVRYRDGEAREIVAHVAVNDLEDAA